MITDINSIYAHTRQLESRMRLLSRVLRLNLYKKRRDEIFVLLTQQLTCILLDIEAELSLSILVSLIMCDDAMAQELQIHALCVVPMTKFFQIL